MTLMIRLIALIDTIQAIGNTLHAMALELKERRR